MTHVVEGKSEQCTIGSSNWWRHRKAPARGDGFPRRATATTPYSEAVRTAGDVAEPRSSFPTLDALLQVTRRDLVTRYRRSSLGLIWLFIAPLLTSLVMVLAFSGIFKVPGSQLGSYAFYVLSGVVFVQFVSVGLGGITGSITGARGVITKVRVPPFLFPLASLLTATVTLLIGLAYVVALGLFVGYYPTVQLVLALGVMLTFVLGTGILLADLNSRREDVQLALPIVIQALLYLTPVFYPESIWPPEYAWVFELNPLVSVLRIFRQGLGYSDGVPTVSYVIALGMSAVLMFVSFWVHKRLWHRTLTFL